MPSVTTREFNPTTGALIGNISSLSYGRIVAGAHSSVKVIDFAFTGVTSASNIKLGLLASGGVTVNSSPEGITSDGSAANGNFGCEHSSSFNIATATGPLTRNFSGINTSESAADSSNIEIGSRDATTSQFTYLDVELGSNDLGTGAGVYKVFFDFV
jgi:hypothetical protein